ncbi:patatin-like phospholipase family protein [Nocardioides terrisoli]|uniref:patatin-like phospholipase family protein n=1 Tax=Nocardioides terrisoli TaxID=3388267 RepID=UPI00287BB73D|nr:patatin-like phospholipase family protein [Nocardioides marmorisolisilvae]
MADIPGATSLAGTVHPPVTDVILEGGGVKGIALVGALQPLAEAGYSFARVAGTSAGAMVGAVLAAMQQRGEPVDRLEDIARSLDYSRFRDRGGVARWLGHVPGPFGYLADAISVIFESGAYEGDYLRDWVRGVLAEFDVHTFGDLLLDDPAGDGEMHHRYRLVVVTSDVSRKRLVRFPWDYQDYGLDPDEQLVCDAVRASASIPYFFEPVELRGSRGISTLVDGGLLSNFPIDIFDRADHRTPRWPTIGIRLDALHLDPARHVEPVRDPAHLGVALVETAIEAEQAAQALAPCNLARSVQVDTTTVSSFDFDLSSADEQTLLAAGRSATETFLAGWDFDQWLQECRGVTA